MPACPDGGTCHHFCAETGPCWRVSMCGPLSGVFPGDSWPPEIQRAHRWIDEQRVHGYAALSAPLRDLLDRACSPAIDTEYARQEHIQLCPAPEDGLCVRVEESERELAETYCRRIFTRTRSKGIRDDVAGIVAIFGLDVHETWDY